MENELNTVQKKGMSRTTVGKTWRPDANQLKLLEVMQQEGYNKTIQQACLDAGIGKNQYHRWNQIPAFREWWVASSKEWIRMQLPRTYRALATSAAGDGYVPGAADRKVMLELCDKDYAPKRHLEASIHTRVTWGQLVNDVVGLSAEVIDAEFVELPADDEIVVGS